MNGRYKWKDIKKYVQSKGTSLAILQAYKTLQKIYACILNPYNNNQSEQMFDKLLQFVKQNGDISVFMLTLFSNT